MCRHNSYPPPILYHVLFKQLKASTLRSARFAPSSYVQCQGRLLLINKSWYLGDFHPPIFFAPSHSPVRGFVYGNRHDATIVSPHTVIVPIAKLRPHGPVLLHAPKYSIEKVLKARSSTRQPSLPDHTPSPVREPARRMKCVTERDTTQLAMRIQQ